MYAWLLFRIFKKVVWSQNENGLNRVNFPEESLMKTPRFLLLSLFIAFGLGLAQSTAQSVQEGDLNCFTILVGKKASQDGAVLLAHNEDDRDNLLVNWYKVPHLTHSKGEKIRLYRGGEIPQSRETNAYLWLEMPGFEFSDSYMNEWGVTIASNQCQSKERNGEVENGGIGYFLRRIMAQRARTAREAVKIAGALIEKWGYAASGRTYCIADPNEAWMLAAVQGKHWVAERVPDDAVAIIPNYYTIQQIDLQDTLNFLGAPDIVDYAIQRGWYDPNSGKPFNFRQAYGAPLSLAHYSNVARHWAAINLLAETPYDFAARFPFSFKPKHKISLQDLMTVLRNHYEGTQLEMNPAFNHGNPHHNVIMRICSETNRYGFVAQLRSWLPADVGNVWWIAPTRPCVQPFVPWYFGVKEIPSAYTTADYKSALAHHFDANIQQKEYNERHAYWAFNHYASKVDSNYGALISEIRQQKEKFQENEWQAQKRFEKKLLPVLKKDPRKAQEMLTDFTHKFAEKLLHRAQNGVQ